MLEAKSTASSDEPSVDLASSIVPLGSTWLQQPSDDRNHYSMRHDAHGQCHEWVEDSWHNDAPPKGKSAITGGGHSLGGRGDDEIAIECPLATHFPVKACVDGPWRQGADPHALAGRLGGYRLAQRHHVGLARVIDRLVRAGRVAAQRGQIENAAPAADAHAWQKMAHQLGQGAHIE